MAVTSQRYCQRKWLLKWVVLKSDSGRSKGQRLEKTGPKGETGRCKKIKLDDPKKLNWTVSRNDSRRSKGMKLNGLKKSERTEGQKLDDLRDEVRLRVTCISGFG